MSQRLAALKWFAHKRLQRLPPSGFDLAQPNIGGDGPATVAASLLRP
jgi:hypothetical protein